MTEVTLRLTPPPSKTKVLFLGSDSLEKVMQTYSLFKRQNILVAFEMFSDKALKLVEQSTGSKSPLSSRCNYYIVTEIECPGEPTDGPEQKIMSSLEQALSEELITDGAINQNEAQAKIFWRFREDISESLSKFSPYKNDIAVRISKIPALVKELDPLLAKNYPTWEVIWFGHIGDGNLHINILRPADLSKEDFVKECQKVDNLVFQAVKNHQGSISAEHGVGLTKKA